MSNAADMPNEIDGPLAQAKEIVEATDREVATAYSVLETSHMLQIRSLQALETSRAALARLNLMAREPE